MALSAAQAAEGMRSEGSSTEISAWPSSDQSDRTSPSSFIVTKTCITRSTNPDPGRGEQKQIGGDLVVVIFHFVQC